MLARQADSAIDERLSHGTAGVGFEGYPAEAPVLAKVAGDFLVVGCHRMIGETVEEPVCAFEHRTGPTKSLTREQDRAQSALRRPAGVQALGPGPLRKVFDDARSEAAGDTQGVGQLCGRQPERSTHPERRAQCTNHCRGVKSGTVNCGWGNKCQAARQFPTGCDASQ